MKLPTQKAIRRTLLAIDELFLTYTADDFGDDAKQELATILDEAYGSHRGDDDAVCPEIVSEPERDGSPPSRPVPSHPVPSHPVPSHPVPSHSVLSWIIQQGSLPRSHDRTEKPGAQLLDAGKP